MSGGRSEAISTSLLEQHASVNTVVPRHRRGRFSAALSSRRPCAASAPRSIAAESNPFRATPTPKPRLEARPASHGQHRSAPPAPQLGLRRASRRAFSWPACRIAKRPFDQRNDPTARKSGSRLVCKRRERGKADELGRRQATFLGKRLDAVPHRIGRSDRMRRALLRLDRFGTRASGTAPSKRSRSDPSAGSEADAARTSRRGWSSAGSGPPSRGVSRGRAPAAARSSRSPRQANFSRTIWTTF